jgi:hypothetical protein
MQEFQMYIIIAILALMIFGMVVFFFKRNKQDQKFTRLGSLAFIFIIFGVLFGDSRWIAYSFFGIGIVLAVVDMVQKAKNNKK